MKKNLIWNVYHHNFNADKLEIYNIFNHGGFVEYVKKHKKKYKVKEDFADKLESELFYYFGSKCEWEVIITKKDNKIIMTPWVGSRSNPELDVTNNEDFDWVGFYNTMVEKYINKNDSVKIDVYEQVRYKWDEFVDYCWGNI